MRPISTTPDPLPFSARLRQSTKQAHDDAETQEFVQRLLDGSLNVRALVLLLESLLPVYDQLEASMVANGDDSIIGLFDHRALDRAERLRADLSGFGSRGYRSGSESVHHYVSAITDSATAPQRLLAHHYTRYLGDLAGGQVISRLVQRHYGVDPSMLSYYDFTAIGDSHHYRKTYRALLDLIPWSPTEQAEFIAECEVAYAANAMLFAELAADCGLSGTDVPALRSLSASEGRHGRAFHP